MERRVQIFKFSAIHPCPHPGLTNPFPKRICRRGARRRSAFHKPIPGNCEASPDPLKRKPYLRDHVQQRHGPGDEGEEAWKVAGSNGFRNKLPIARELLLDEAHLSFRFGEVPFDRFGESRLLILLPDAFIRLIMSPDIRRGETVERQVERKPARETPGLPVPEAPPLVPAQGRKCPRKVPVVAPVNSYQLNQ